MSYLKQRINLIHYDIWRFERWTRRLVFEDEKLTGIQSSLNQKYELDDSNPGALHNQLPNYNAKHFSILLFLILSTLLNFLCGFFLLGLQLWVGGIIVSGILAFIISIYVAPSDRKRYLKVFVKFESMSVAQKRNSGLITFLIVVGIWSAFLGSFFILVPQSIH